MPGMNTGINAALITQLGTTVTLETESVTVDSSSDWDDETYTAETDTGVKAIVDSPRSATTSLGETGRGVAADRILWLRDDVSHTLSDGTGDSAPTLVTIDGVGYVVQEFEDRGTGVIRLEVARA